VEEDIITDKAHMEVEVVGREVAVEEEAKEAEVEAKEAEVEAKEVEGMDVVGDGAGAMVDAVTMILQLMTR
jgi:hypothetical protein